MRGKFNISNKLSYTLITLAILIGAVGLVFAFRLDNSGAPSVFGHSIGEIAPPTSCQPNQVLTWDGSEWKCATPTSSAIDGVDWIKTSVKGGPNWVPMRDKWTYVDTGDTSLKRLKINAFMDVFGNKTSGTETYFMHIFSNNVALDRHASRRSGTETLIMDREFQAPSTSKTQFQVSVEVTTTDRYVMLDLSGSTITCSTAYYGLEVIKFSS